MRRGLSLTRVSLYSEYPYTPIQRGETATAANFILSTFYPP